MTDPWWLIHPVGILACAGLAWATFSPSSGIWGPMIRQGPANRSSVALTFDDGPTPGATDRVLDLLAEQNMLATFFVVGQNVKRHPDLLRQIHQHGHLIGNHTFDHSHWGVFGFRHWWNEQLRRTDDLIADTLGVRPALFRPPMGHKTPHTFKAAQSLGCLTVVWNRSAGDGLHTSAQRVVRRLATPRPGDILLLHDGIEPNSPRRNPAATLAALPKVLQMISEKAMKAERLDTLLNVAGYRQSTTSPHEAPFAATSR